MTPAVVDTDVGSFLFKNDSRAQLYLPLLQHRKLLVSFMTEAELEQWIVLAKSGAGRIQRFHEFMKGFAAVPSSRVKVGRSNGRGQGERPPNRCPRCVHRPTALDYGADLVTPNPKDYLAVPSLTVLSCS